MAENSSGKYLNVKVKFEILGQQFEAVTQIHEDDLESMDWNLLLIESLDYNGHEVLD